MKKTMCSLIFCYRPLNDRNNQSRGSLCLRFVYKRKSATISSGFVLYREEWDSIKQKVILPYSLTERSSYLQSVVDKIDSINELFVKIVRQLDEQGGTYTVQDIARIYRYHSEYGNLSAYCLQQEVQLSKGGQQRTARAYRSAVRSLITFNKGKELALNDITPYLLKEYERHLKERGKSLNTISFYMRNLRSLYNKSLTDRIIIHKNHKNPFVGVYTGVDQTKKRALSLDEIIKLRDLDVTQFSDSRYRSLHRSKRLFFFCFYARGMSFVDMAYLRKENIRKGIISYYRKKTGQLIEIKLTSELREIIKSFAEETKQSKYLFPIIKNETGNIRLQYENGLRTYNKGLKELSELCSIDKGISSHVARHSWATIAKHEHLPLSVISEGLGHSNEKTTYIYLASFERSFLDEANELIGHAVKRGNRNPQHAVSSQ